MDGSGPLDQSHASEVRARIDETTYSVDRPVLVLFLLRPQALHAEPDMLYAISYPPPKKFSPQPITDAKLDLNCGPVKTVDP